MSLIHCQTDRRHFCVYMKFFIIFIRRAYYAKNKISGIHFYPYHIRLLKLHNLQTIVTIFQT